MRPPSTDFDAWVFFARRHGLGPWAALVLESLEPLSLLVAQATYLMEPLVGRSTAGAWRRVLEDEDRREGLRRRLRRATDSGAGG